VAAPDLAASASIPSGKKNSRGGWHLRQIEVNYEVLPQVRHDVTERRSAYAAEPGGQGGIRTGNRRGIMSAMGRDRCLEMAAFTLRALHTGARMRHRDTTSTAPTVRLPTRRIR
jgi:hypothetical protein